MAVTSSSLPHRTHRAYYSRDWGVTVITYELITHVFSWKWQISSVVFIHAHTPCHLPRPLGLFPRPSELPVSLSVSLCKCMCHFISRLHLFFMEANCTAPLCAELCLRNPQRWPLITRPSTPPTHQQLNTDSPSISPHASRFFTCSLFMYLLSFHRVFLFFFPLPLFSSRFLGPFFLIWPFTFPFVSISICLLFSFPFFLSPFVFLSAKFSFLYRSPSSIFLLRSLGFIYPHPPSRTQSCMLHCVVQYLQCVCFRCYRCGLFDGGEEEEEEFTSSLIWRIRQ